MKLSHGTLQLSPEILKKAKSEAAVERAILAEKNHLSSESKTQKVEKELEKLQKKMRESSEMALLQEIAQLKGQLAELEVRVERESSECKRAQLEKEQYKNQIHRLVSQRMLTLIVIYVRRVLLTKR
jgi:hypothetical protein